MGKLWRMPEAAVARIVSFNRGLHDGLNDAGGEIGITASERFCLLNGTNYLLRLFSDFVRFFAVSVCDGKQHSSKTRPAVLIGHAFGNRVARATAADHPEAVSGLILLAAGGQVAPAPDVAKALAEVFDTSVSPAQHRADVQKAFFAPGNDPSVWLDGWHPAAMRAQGAAVRATGADAWQGGGRADVLIVQASDDLVAPPANAEVLARAHPDRVKVVVLPHAGHAMLPEQPDQIARIVIAYLRSHP